MKVAVALIMDENNRVLIAKRPNNVPHGGCWEFPGGKLELNETPESALIREIDEEIGIEIVDFNYLGEISFQYPKKLVNLLLFHVSHFRGVPTIKAKQQALKWEYVHNLNPSDFPEANKIIIEQYL